jgi:hypothetical protein
MDGVLSGGEKDLVMAYVDGEFRGIVGGIYFKPTESFAYPMMVYSNVSEGEILTFKYYDADTDQILPCVETLTFSADMIVANALESFDLNASSAVRLDDQIGGNGFSLDVYPNPFNDQLHIQYSLNERSRVRLEVYDILGKLVEILDECNLDPGSYTTEWNAESHTKGTYILKLSTESSSLIKKIILLK